MERCVAPLCLLLGVLVRGLWEEFAWPSSTASEAPAGWLSRLSLSRKSSDGRSEEGRSSQSRSQGGGSARQFMWRLDAGFCRLKVRLTASIGGGTTPRSAQVPGGATIFWWVPVPLANLSMTMALVLVAIMGSTNRDRGSTPYLKHSLTHTLSS